MRTSSSFSLLFDCGGHHSRWFAGEETSIKGQGPGLVNVLLAATHTATRSRPPLCGANALMLGWLQKNVHQSWPLALNHPRSWTSCWVAAKRTFTIPCPWPLNPQVVNELLWVAGQRTFTIPGPWPLVRLVSGVVNELLGWQPKERSPSLAPGPFVFICGFLTCLTRYYISPPVL